MDIASIIMSVVSAIGAGFKQYQERKTAEHEVLMAREEARKEIAMATVKAELQLGQAQIKATSPWFKHFTFFMWFAPFIITTMFPEWGKQIFDNWQVMPAWYAKSCVGIMFTLWGIQVGKAYIADIFAGASEFFKQRAELKFNRKIFMDTMRSTNGPIGQYEVELYDKAIDAGLKTLDKGPNNQS